LRTVTSLQRETVQHNTIIVAIQCCYYFTKHSTGSNHVQECCSTFHFPSLIKNLTILYCIRNNDCFVHHRLLWLSIIVSLFTKTYCIRINFINLKHYIAHADDVPTHCIYQMMRYAYIPLRCNTIYTNSYIICMRVVFIFLTTFDGPLISLIINDLWNMIEPGTPGG